MCEVKKRNALNIQYDRTKMRFIKMSRWELPNTKSQSYWNDVCNNLERKVRNVRDPFSHFPFISHSNNNLGFDPHDSAEFNNLSKVQSHDEPIVKVSPPTPSRKSSYNFATDAFQDRNFTVNKKDTQIDDNFMLKLQSLIEKKEKNTSRAEKSSVDKINFSNIQIFSKKACPYHKNEPPPQIFDDDLRKYLPKRKLSEKSVDSYKQPSFGLCSLHSSKTDKDDKIMEKLESKASLEQQIDPEIIQNSGNLIITDDFKIESDIKYETLPGIQKYKAPKLGKASLLASFAKTVSIPSSVETHESSDEDYSKSDSSLDSQFSKKFISKAESEETLISSKRICKDYLRVPKLGYASLHPSFRKLVPMDSFPNEEEIEIQNNSIPKIVSEYSFNFNKPEPDQIDENIEFKTLLEKSSVVSSINERIINDDLSKSQYLKQSETQEVVDFSKKQNYCTRYAYRALKQITKNKDLQFFPEECGLEKVSSKSSSSSESTEPAYKIRKRRNERVDSTTHRIIREKLRAIAPKYLGENFFQPSKESEEIKTIYSSSRSTSGSSTKFQNTQFESRSLTNIPSIKIYPRKNSDRCLPCLCESFKEPQKSKRELPLAILSSIVKESSIEISESDESSVSLPDLKIPDFGFLIPDGGSKLESSTMTKDLIKIEEDDKKSQISQESESVLSKDHSLSPKSTDFKNKSGSAQSTDLSKPSTPSGQSSESEDTRAEASNDALDISKYLAPCHAPLVWKPNMESLKALRSRKAISMQSRVTAITSKSLDDSDLEDSLSDIPSPKDSRKPPIKTVTIQSPRSKVESDKETHSEEKSDVDKVRLKEKRKRLARTKTVAGQIDISKGDEEKKCRFIRARTSVDLTCKVSDSKKMSFDADDSAESIASFNENLAKVKEDSKDGEKSFELSKDHQELLEILEKCLEEQKSSGEILQILCDWYSVRNTEIRKGNTDPDLKRALKISLNLLRLLAESRRYLNSDNFSPDLEFSLQQPLLCNSRQLRRVLPHKLYNKVAPILNMPVWYPKNTVEIDADVAKNCHFKEETSTSNLSSDLIVHPPSEKESSPDNRQSKSLNPYARFLRKPRRKAVIWRPLKEEDLKGYNPDASLHNRATKVTDKICHDFCEWLRGLSGPLERINEEVLKDMFQIIFTADACKSTKVLVKEMPTVPKPIALIRNTTGAIDLEMIRKELFLDSKIENQPKRTFAFGTALPKKLRFVPPKNQVDDKWFSCKNIDHDLETMEVVWHGIKHLEITKRYANWLKTNTNIKTPEILNYDAQTTVSLSKFSQEDTIAQEEYEQKNIIYH